MDLDGILGLQKLKNESKHARNSAPSLYQAMVLEQIYGRVHYPSKENVSNISICLNMDSKHIRKWFKDKRETAKFFECTKIKDYTEESVENNKKSSSKMLTDDIIKICISMHKKIKKEMEIKN